LFTRELEDALIDGRIDMAVHSMKDVPTLGHERLEIGGVLERADPRDGFISENVKGVLDLPQEAMIGTASIRRRAQLSRLRPDIKFCLLRGNVGTRLSKLKDGLFDATFLACAGLKRLGQSDVITQEVPPELMLPAPAQGAIGIEHRRDDESIALAIAALNHSSSQMAIWAERAFLEALDGSCRTPIAALATLDGEAMSFRGEVIATDGSKHYGTQALETIASKEAARDLGLAMGAEVKTQIGDIDLWDRD